MSGEQAQGLSGHLPSSTSPEQPSQLAQNPTTPPEVLESLARQGDEATLRELAGNPNLPLKLLFRLGEMFPSRFLANPILPLLLLEYPTLPFEMPTTTLLRVLEVEEVPTTFLEWGVRHLDPKIREAVARHPKTPSSLLSQLAGDSSFMVCLALAEHPRTPQDLLIQLAGTTYQEIRRAVAQHPGMPAAFLQLLRRAGASSDLGGYASPDRSLSWEKLSPLLQEGPFIRSLVARHPNTPTDVLEKLSWEHEALVREAVLKNPSLPRHIFKRIAAERYRV